MVKLVFVINGKYFILNTEANTYEPAELADRPSEDRIVSKVLNGEITKKGG